jgi:metal-sulfur cluster biosynthetic enzyme
METLSRWAAVSDGLVFKAEECPKATDLVGQIRTKVEQLRVSQKTPQQVGVNAWTLSMVLSCLTAEWLLRKRWLLT